MFIGAIVGWFISVVVNSSKIDKLENEVEELKNELKKRVRTSTRQGK
jgi:Tfp pilus assembly protein PilO